MKINYLFIVSKGGLEEVVWTGCQSGASILLSSRYHDNYIFGKLDL